MTHFQKARGGRGERECLLMNLQLYSCEDLGSDPQNRHKARHLSEHPQSPHFYSKAGDRERKSPDSWQPASIT